MRIADRHLRATAIFLFGMCAGALLMAPSTFTEGRVVEIDDRLYALVVSSGIRNPAAVVVEKAGGSLDLDRGSVDTLKSSVLAMAAVREMLGLKNQPSLLLDPTEDRAGWRAGFRPGDLVTSVTFTDPGCPDPASRESLFQLWSQLKTCAGKVSLLRDGEPLQIEIAKAMTYGVITVQLRGSLRGPTPPRLERSNGNSAGLPLALHYADLLSPGELFSIDVVAATGAIAPQSGAVLEIGGLIYKSEAAAAAGATVLFVPEGQFDEVDPALGLEVRGVDSIEAAIAFLCARGAADALCESPTPAVDRAKKTGSAKR